MMKTTSNDASAQSAAGLFSGPVYSLENRAAHQRKVLDFIHAEIAAGRGFPKRITIRDHMGWKNRTGVRSVLLGLVNDGVLEFRKIDGPRGWVIAIPGGPSEQFDPPKAS